MRAELQEHFKKAGDILSGKPWAQIINYVDTVNAQHPDALSLKVTSVNTEKGLAEIMVIRSDLPEGARLGLIFQSFTSPDLEMLKQDRNYDGMGLDIPHTHIVVGVTSVSNSGGPRVFSGCSAPIQLIKEDLIPDLKIAGLFEVPSMSWKLGQ